MNTSRLGLVKKKRRGSYFKCETCGREFYVFPSEIKKAHKKGITIRYCCIGCYDKTGDKNPFWKKKHKKISIEKMKMSPNRPRFGYNLDNPNFVRFGEEYGFEGSSKMWWQRKLLNEIGKCEKCGFDDKRALCIHHKDKNRGNNIRKNLILLCWNCHIIEHFEDRSGLYKYLKTDSFKRSKNVEKV